MTADSMHDALHEVAGMESGVQAGEVLAEGGWAVFPTPLAHPREACERCNKVHFKRPSVAGKHDMGAGALDYTNATTDPQVWRVMANGVMDRHPVPDVNIAVSPWRCAVPLIGLDLDGQESMRRLGEVRPDWRSFSHVESSGKGGGAHLYVAGASEPVSGVHPWGGELRCVFGHLMLPPSLVNGRRDYYRPAGDAFLTVADLPALMEGERVRTRKEGTRGSRPLSMEAAEEAVDALSAWAADAVGTRTLFRHLDLLAVAVPGERHPTAVSAVACAVEMAKRRTLPLRWALDVIIDVFPLTAEDRGRDIRFEVYEIASWVLGQEDQVA